MKKNKDKKVNETIFYNQIGEEIHQYDDGESEAVFVKKFGHRKSFKETGEQWCPDCHTKMIHNEDYWECPKCFFSIGDDEVEEGYGWPTLEASYEDDYGDSWEDVYDEDE